MGRIRPLRGELAHDCWNYSTGDRRGGGNGQAVDSTIIST
jgi:hypothetical protein